MDDFLKYPNEIVMLLIGLCVLVFIIKNRKSLKRLPAYGILIAAFYMLFATWFATILEDFFWEDFFNLLEHAGLALSSVLTAVWCWKAFTDRRKEG